MNSIVITPKTKDELRFLKSLLKKLGYQAKELTEEDLENAGLLYLMISEKKEDYVSEKEILDALK